MSKFTETDQPPTKDGWFWMKITSMKYPTWRPVEISVSNGNLLYIDDGDGRPVKLEDFLEYHRALWSLEEIETPVKTAI